MYFKRSSGSVRQSGLLRYLVSSSNDIEGKAGALMVQGGFGSCAFWAQAETLATSTKRPARQVSIARIVCLSERPCLTEATRTDRPLLCRATSLPLFAVSAGNL